MKKLKAINKMQVYNALEETLQNVSSIKPKFCSSMCYRKIGHKGFCVMLVDMKNVYETKSTTK